MNSKKNTLHIHFDGPKLGFAQKELLTNIDPVLIKAGCDSQII
jgi:hypothetical protein